MGAWHAHWQKFKERLDKHFAPLLGKDFTKKNYTLNLGGALDDLQSKLAETKEKWKKVTELQKGAVKVIKGETEQQGLIQRTGTQRDITTDLEIVRLSREVQAGATKIKELAKKIEETLDSYESKFMKRRDAADDELQTRFSRDLPAALDAFTDFRDTAKREAQAAKEWDADAKKFEKDASGVLKKK